MMSCSMSCSSCLPTLTSEGLPQPALLPQVPLLSVFPERTAPCLVVTGVPHPSLPAAGLVSQV
jgi:hypothetical protein